MAESAAHAGYRATVIDGYADLDLCAVADRVERCAPFSAAAAARLARDVRCDAVIYGSGCENDARAVAALARGRTLWGNRPSVLRRVRNPFVLARVLARLGVPAPRVRASGPRVGSDAARIQWLIKPRRSGGGHGIAAWRSGDRVPRRHVLQERIRGVPGSIVFVADGVRAVPLGISRQLVGERRFGASGFRYCGSILAPAGDPVLPHDAELLGRATAIAAALTREFGLVGVNGIDFVARRGVPYVLEINPRYSASMELVERHYGISIIAIHAAACRGVLPRFDLSATRARRGAIAKAILYARRTITPGDTTSWLSTGDIADIPPPHTQIPTGRPICTVFATGVTAATCHERLLARAVAVGRLSTR